MSLPVRPEPSPPTPQTTSLGWPVGAGLVLVLVVTLVVGLQLGALPWRFRKQMWQLQGALAGGAVGLVIGVSISRRRKP
jgi:FtsH-binding integral membrane protein